MTKKEIKSKFDEIVDFAGVERYIDTPVKRYSSGMYVRLAFGVAAHLEPEILIVDEVLAVGDSEFQKKALGKMKDVSGKDGRTVLFVSHNMAAVKQLCKSGLLLRNGKIFANNSIDSIVSDYLTNDIPLSSKLKPYSEMGYQKNNPKLLIQDIELNGFTQGNLILSHELNFISVKCNIICRENCYIAIEAKVKDESGFPLASYSNSQKNSSVKYFDKGQHEIKETIHLPAGIMKGNYMFSLYLTYPGYEYHYILEDKIWIDYQGSPMATGSVIEYKSGNGWLLLS
jgi:lipopolysaccharide transport system ATP-binding protein